ncbi:hypothetical protein PPERSA_05373 [Pseudocohnilembus persalinus]|uniref:Uncharacterized protein n=1 Tax=Pseudocohnilembus persalinus TaxID=266149 RepID=A0A0V0R7T8_PSEPJ|nr:hypothetical protein PPERSA_05373 [Pseudocohnilembus persalinus]|eukprot:KRX10553.1 hypothetical protein PPERSA_05373 [Pseudocohnilembus persalinus]
MSNYNNFQLQRKPKLAKISVFNFHSAVVHAFPQEKKEGQKAPLNPNSIGPGHYSPEKPKKKNEPKFSIQKAKRPGLPKNFGPNKFYQQTEFVGKEGPKFSMASKSGKNNTVEKYLASVPEAGKYDPKIYAQYEKIAKNYSFGLKLSNTNKEQISKPGPGFYNDKFGMITKHDDEKFQTMSETTKKYIQNIGKKRHGTIREMLKRPGSAPQYGFNKTNIDESQLYKIGVDHGLTEEQVQKNKIKMQEKHQKLQQKQHEQILKEEEFKRKQNEIPKIKRKIQKTQNPNYADLQNSKYGFSQYENGKKKQKIPQNPKLNQQLIEYNKQKLAEYKNKFYDKNKKQKFQYIDQTYSINNQSQQLQKLKQDQL